jgi:predicted DNA-binding WGR domain protein
MADTHINAFFAEADEAEKKVLAAHAEWEEAKSRLEAKKKEVGYVETNNTDDVAKEDESSKVSKKK